MKGTMFWVAILLLVVGAGLVMYSLLKKPKKEEEMPPPAVFTCLYCGTEFSSEAELNNHIASEHPGEPLAYTCHYCGDIFSSEVALIAHIATAHPGEPEEPEDGGTITTFKYTSNIRTKETQEEGAGGILWHYFDFEVDIKNDGETAGIVHPIAHYDSAMTVLGGKIESQKLSPGQIETFKGQWKYYLPNENFWFRPTYIESEAGKINFELGEVKPMTVSIPSQIASNQPYWAKIRAWLDVKPDIIYNLQVDLKPTFTWPLPAYERPEPSCMVVYGIAQEGYKPPYGTPIVLKDSGYYTVSGIYLWEWERTNADPPNYKKIGNQWVNQPAWATTGNTRKPLPKGIYEVVATLGYGWVKNYTSGEVNGWWIVDKQTVGQVTVV